MVCIYTVLESYILIVVNKSLVRREFFLSNGVRHVCVNCVGAEQSAWMQLHIDSGADVRIWRKLRDMKLSVIAEKKTNGI